MPARGVTHDRNPVEINRLTVFLKRRQVIDAGSHVLQRSGPPAARHSDTTIFKIPNRESAMRQVDRNGRDVIPAVRHAPETAMQEANDGCAPRAAMPGMLRQIQVTHVIRRRAVGDGPKRHRRPGS
jgi:hypothetical protein